MSNLKTRSRLIEKFSSQDNAQKSGYEDLINSSLNMLDDSVEKFPGNPLTITSLDNGDLLCIRRKDKSQELLLTLTSEGAMKISSRPEANYDPNGWSSGGIPGDNDQAPSDSVKSILEVAEIQSEQSLSLESKNGNVTTLSQLDIGKGLKIGEKGTPMGNLQLGTFTLTEALVAGQTFSQYVSFEKTYATPPMVFLTVSLNGNEGQNETLFLAASLLSVKNDGFQAGLRVWDGLLDDSAKVGIQWMAIGG